MILILAHEDGDTLQSLNTNSSSTFNVEVLCFYPHKHSLKGALFFSHVYVKPGVDYGILYTQLYTPCNFVC